MCCSYYMYVIITHAFEFSFFFFLTLALWYDKPRLYHLVKCYEIFPLTWAKEVECWMSDAGCRMSDFHNFVVRFPTNKDSTYKLPQFSVLLLSVSYLTQPLFYLSYFFELLSLCFSYLIFVFFLYIFFSLKWKSPAKLNHVKKRKQNKRNKQSGKNISRPAIALSKAVESSKMVSNILNSTSRWNFRGWQCRSQRFSKQARFNSEAWNI